MWMWWIALLLLFLAGLGIGFLWGRSTTDASRKAEKLDQELRETRTALEAYKDEVNAHFATTAQLVEQLTENYKAVYRHLAEGSEKLCGPNAPRLPQPGPEALEGETIKTPESAPQTDQQTATPAAESEEVVAQKPSQPEAGQVETSEAQNAPQAQETAQAAEGEDKTTEVPSPETPAATTIERAEERPPRSALH